MWERGDSTAPATVLQQPELRTHREVQNQTPLLQRLEVTAYGSCKPEPNCTWVAACLPGRTWLPRALGTEMLLTAKLDAVSVALPSTVQPFT